ncbi:MAG: hypothetical protein K0R77_1677 [Chryseobacterium sp.]|uniref:hypothetical protein n=1 Tax=Chryseobacterium sp. TaxID=1871047 RepID=UPI002629F40F|nr:hypothetical protein [Chryseobacterium sp.]MDF2552402.1 hypothetical protein [Chryseobacterium sp.]
MRLSNRTKTPIYNFINTLLLMMLLGGIIGFILEKYKFQILGGLSYLLIIVPILLLILYYVSGRQIFEYDSDGEALHFKNRNVVPFLNRPLNDEFPKYKLMKFETINMLFFVRRLYITISSKNSGSTVLKYEISYLTQKEVNDLKFSLNKVTKANKERRH